MWTLAEHCVRRLLLRRGIRLTRTDDLTCLADNFGSDKGSRFDGHGYTRIYKRLFETKRKDELIFLEIGLNRPESDNRRTCNAVEGTTTAAALRAPSLEMWRAFFPRARIYGFDIDDFSKIKIDGCKIVRGDMSSHTDLQRLVDFIGRPIDIIVDDASHASLHQQIALGSLFSHIRSGGMYIIEDLHWQDPALERKETPKTRDVMRRLQSDGLMISPVLTRTQQQYIQNNIAQVFLFDSLTETVSDASDALAVLIKK